MPDKTTNDLITDQEMAFARLILSGTMSDQRAAEQAGFEPSVAAYLKARPRVAAFIQQHREATQQQQIEDEADNLRARNLSRERVLERLWQIAEMSPESTRGSITSQVKAIAMIVAIEGLIPAKASADSKAAQKQAAPLPKYEIYQAAWLREQNERLANGGTLRPNANHVASDVGETGNDTAFTSHRAETPQNHQEL